ncbi:MAG: YceD family protein [Xanthobacteraceae bacterium]
MILKRFRLNPWSGKIDDLYGAIVAQSRREVFYTGYSVPDTIEGRFDVIVLHIVVMLASLDRAGPAARGIGQNLFDRFCRDLDANLREMGIGDLAVPKRMRQFGEAFYGRQAAYLAALAAPDRRKLEKALARNIFQGIDGAGPRRLARYARALARRFEVQDQAALLRGAVVFPDPEAIPMSEPKAPNSAAPNSVVPNSVVPWHIPVAVEEIAETGEHFDLVADASVRAAVAAVAGLRDLPRFEARFDVTRRGSGGLHVVGSVSATVGQTCVVTLEPLANQVEETIDLMFEPPQRVEQSADTEAPHHGVKWDEPEPLVGGVVDLGVLATEFLILGLDPYPRKPGAVFEPPQDAKRDQGPFAALGRLAKRQE